MSRTATYDFRKVSLILGPHIASGFAESDEAITIEYPEDRWSRSTGADGDTTRSKSNNNQGDLTIRLQASSKTNDYLAGVKTLDDTLNAGLIPVLLKDNNGTTVASGTFWVAKTPAVNKGKSASDMEWVLHTGELQLLPGGLN